MVTKHPGFEDEDYKRRRNYIASKVAEDCADIVYTDAENKTWSYVYNRLNELYPKAACKAFCEVLSSTEINCETIPQFSLINKALSVSKFKVLPVKGLIDTRTFLEKLAESTMLCTRYIRHQSHPEYTPEPDIIHEVMGHCLFFNNPIYRELNRAFGKAALRSDDAAILKLSRLYWYSVEFGICTENTQPRAYGAGLLSSIKELSSISTISTLPFDCNAIMSAEYDTMKPHTTLYRSEFSFEKTAQNIILFLDKF